MIKTGRKFALNYSTTMRKYLHLNSNTFLKKGSKKVLMDLGCLETPLQPSLRKAFLISYLLDNKFRKIQ